MKHITLIIIASFLSACAHEPIDNSLQFDPNEKIIHGKVTEKKEADKEIIKKRFKEKETNKAIGLTFETILSLATGINAFSHDVDDSVTSAPLEYVVKLNNGKFLKVSSAYSGFAIGDCVKVFISENRKKYPPRMAYGGEC